MKETIVQFKKKFTSAWFFISAAAAMILFFCTQIYVSAMTNDRYSAVTALMNFDRTEMLRHFELCSYSVISNARYGWFTLFAPLSAAFCFVPMICAEQENNALRFQLIRSSKLKFNLSRFLAGVLSGGFSAALGYGLFAAAVLALFPKAAEYSYYFEFQSGEEILGYLKMLCGVFIYGTYWSMPAMFCTCLLKNKYLIMCIPFFIKYCTVQFVQLNTQRLYSDLENVNMQLLNLLNMINPDSVLYFENYSSLRVPLFCLGVSLAMLAGYLIINKARRDQGA